MARDPLPQLPKLNVVGSIPITRSISSKRPGFQALRPRGRESARQCPLVSE